MRNTKLDALRTVELIYNPIKEGNDNIFRPYFNTNEDIDTVLSITDIKDKDIFCVQASSDQLFKCIEKDALSIDTFDINYLSKYFYYLKKNYLFTFNNILDTTASKLELLDCIDNFDMSDPDEAEAHNYWLSLLEIISIDEFYKLFYISPKYNDFDIDKIKYRLKNFKLNFNLVNMFENNYYSNKQYDVVIMSNIMERISMDSKTHDLLRRIVKPTGEIICSNVSTFDISEHSLYERAKMEEYFFYNDGITILDEEQDILHQASYKYIKK